MMRLSFFKLNVEEMEPALAFWQETFGFELKTTYDETDFLEHILTLPGDGPSADLMLVRYKDGRTIETGNGYGPLGLACDDIEAAHAKAIACGAVETLAVFEVVGVKVSMLRSPQGHEIELIQRLD